MNLPEVKNGTWKIRRVICNIWTRQEEPGYWPTRGERVVPVESRDAQERLEAAEFYNTGKRVERFHLRLEVGDFHLERVVDDLTKDTIETAADAIFEEYEAEILSRQFSNPSVMEIVLDEPAPVL